MRSVVTLALIGLTGCAGPASGKSGKDGSETGMETSADIGTDVETCVKATIEIGAFTNIADPEVGALQPADLDADGDTDLVGSNGWMLLQGQDTVEVRMVEAFSGSFARPGQVHGDGTFDIVARGQGLAEILVYPAPALAGGDVVATNAIEFWAYTLGDVTGDGFDDVALMSKAGKSVEMWTGAADGKFSPGVEVALDLPATAIALADVSPESGPDLDLVVSNSMEVLLFAGDGTGAFDPGTPVEQTWVWYLAGIDVFGSGSFDLLMAYSFTQLTGVNGVGLAHFAGGEWGGSFQELDASPYELTWDDVTNDGTLEIALASRTDPGGLEILCVADDLTVSSCAALDLAHRPAGVGLLRNADGGNPRIVYSTDDDGVWMADLDVRVCD